MHRNPICNWTARKSIAHLCSSISKVGLFSVNIFHCNSSTDVAFSLLYFKNSKELDSTVEACVLLSMWAQSSTQWSYTQYFRYCFFCVHFSLSPQHTLWCAISTLTFFRRSLWTWRVASSRQEHPEEWTLLLNCKEKLCGIRDGHSFHIWTFNTLLNILRCYC